MRALLPCLPTALVASLGLGAGACGFDTPATDEPDAGTPPDAGPGCAVGFAGAACVLALHDEAVTSCAPETVELLRTELDARAGIGPLWADGRALFRTDVPVQIAGGFNAWSPTALRSRAVCDSELVVAVGPVASGHWPYKLFDGETWSLDPRAPAFAFDDFAGNPDRRNSVLNTPDSGRGHLVALDQACSPSLGSCRDVTAYLPAGYAAPEDASRGYPVLFMHDGQNVWDDHGCCFGHTGWEVNVALDTEIAAGRVAPMIVIAAASTVARNAEYGLAPATMETFMTFQVTELQPAALAQVRWDGGKLAIAGSSLGGLVSMHLALRSPDVYSAVASLSGAFWPGMANGTALRDHLPTMGKQPLAIYLDHGGDPTINSDGAADSMEVRDLLIELGWQRGDSPACEASADALCYHAEPGAQHDELAWKARTWRFLRFLFPA